MRTLATTFTALSDPARLRIFNLLLAGGTLCVCDLQDVLGFTQTKVSRHMRCLRRAGIVKTRKKGRWVYYSLAPLDRNTEPLYRFLDGVLPSQDGASSDTRRLKQLLDAGSCAGTASCCTPVRSLLSGSKRKAEVS
jgi:ArsR family transcriptional regulator